MQAEVVYLGMLKHPHLVKLIGYGCEDEQRMLVYEYMDRGSLEHHLFTSKLVAYTYIRCVFLASTYVRTCTLLLVRCWG